MRLNEVLNQKGIDFPRTSFDIIGDVAIIQFPEGFKKKRVVAEAIMEMHKHVKTVCEKVGRIEGEERVPEIKKILGNNTETVHRENGFSFELDVKKVFFTPRMQNERLRILNQIKHGEKILDMFAGVGPYAIPAARKSEVHAIDINEDATKYLRRNAELNKVDLEVYTGDCKEIIEKNNLEGFDRIIMNFPKGAKEFLGTAIGAGKKGCSIHLYVFEKESEKTVFPDNVEIMDRNICGDVAPGLQRVCYDLVKK